MHIPKPRNSYPFHKMNIGDVHSVKITEADPRAGARALCAAYAYGKRHNWRFCGNVRRGTKHTYMDIARWK